MNNEEDFNLDALDFMDSADWKHGWLSGIFPLEGRSNLEGIYPFSLYEIECRWS